MGFEVGRPPPPLISPPRRLTPITIGKMYYHVLKVKSNEEPRQWNTIFVSLAVVVVVLNGDVCWCISGIKYENLQQQQRSDHQLRLWQ